MRKTLERIRSLASVLQIRDGQLVRLARDVAHDNTLLDLEYMCYEDAVELEAFLATVMAHESKLVGVNG